MCKFLSAIGMKNGDILCDPSVDSHEDIISIHELNDNNSKLRNWVRLEFSPEKDKDLIDVEKYKLRIDDTEFDWVTTELKLKWIRKLKAKLKRIIITKNTKTLASGTYILSGAIIEKPLYCRIYYAGNSMIINAEYSTIEYAGNSMIINAGYSMIINAGYSKIKDAGNSKIKDAGNSKIEDAGYSKIEYAGNSKIKDAGNSTIKYPKS